MLGYRSVSVRFFDNSGLLLSERVPASRETQADRGSGLRAPHRLLGAGVRSPNQTPLAEPTSTCLPIPIKDDGT